MQNVDEELARKEAKEYLLDKGVGILSGLTRSLETIAHQIIGRLVEETGRANLENAIRSENEKFSRQWQQVVTFSIGKWGEELVQEILQDLPEVFTRLQTEIP